MTGVFLATVVLALVTGLAGGLLSKFLWATTAAPDSEPGAIRATNLAFVDGQGRERAVIKLIDGRPILVLAEEHNLGSGDWVSTPRVAVGILQDGAPGLELADLDGKTRVSLAVTANGSSLLELLARNSKAHITLSVTADGIITLQSFDDTRNQVAQWP